MVHPQVADEGDDLQIQRVVANILIEQSHCQQGLAVKEYTCYKMPQKSMD
jgi:hypothetical protein